MNLNLISALILTLDQISDTLNNIWVSTQIIILSEVADHVKGELSDMEFVWFIEGSLREGLDNGCLVVGWKWLDKLRNYNREWVDALLIDFWFDELDHLRGILLLGDQGEKVEQTLGLLDDLALEIVGFAELDASLEDLVNEGLALEASQEEDVDIDSDSGEVDIVVIEEFEWGIDELLGFVLFKEAWVLAEDLRDLLDGEQYYLLDGSVLLGEIGGDELGLDFSKNLGGGGVKLDGFLELHEGESQNNLDQSLCFVFGDNLVVDVVQDEINLVLVQNFDDIFQDTWGKLEEGLLDDDVDILLLEILLDLLDDGGELGSKTRELGLEIDLEKSEEMGEGLHALTWDLEEGITHTLDAEIDDWGNIINDVINSDLVLTLDQTLQDAESFVLEIVVTWGSQLSADDLVGFDPESWVFDNLSVNVVADIFQELDNLNLVRILGLPVKEDGAGLVKKSLDEGLEVDFDGWVNSSDRGGHVCAEEIVVLDAWVIEFIWSLFFNGDDLDDGLDTSDDLLSDTWVSFTDSLNEEDSLLVDDLLVEFLDEIGVMSDQISDELDRLLSDLPGIFRIIEVVVVVILVFVLVFHIVLGVLVEIKLDSGVVLEELGGDIEDGINMWSHRVRVSLDKTCYDFAKFFENLVEFIDLFVIEINLLVLDISSLLVLFINLFLEILEILK